VYCHRVLAAEVPDLARLAFADETCQVCGTKAGIDASHPRTGLAEDGRVGGNREVAQHVKHVASADRIAVDHGDDGLGDIADDAVKGGHFHAQAPLGIAVLGALLLVPSTRKSLVACPREDDYTDAQIVPGPAEGIDQLAYGLGAKGVASLRPVYGYPGDTIGRLVKDILVGHNRTLLSLFAFSWQIGLEDAIALRAEA